MGAFLSAIGGAGNAAGNVGAQVRSQQFQGQQNLLQRQLEERMQAQRLWQEQRNTLGSAIERASQMYPGPEGERLRDLQLEVGSLAPGTDLQPYFSKYSQHRQFAEKAVPGAVSSIPHPATIAGQISAAPDRVGIPTIGGPQNTPPASAALPGSNPLQGGGPAGGGGFLDTSAVPQQPVQPAQPVGQTAPLAPLDLLGPSLAAFRATNYADPFVQELIGNQAKLEGAKQRLAALEQYIQPVAQSSPELANVMRMEVLGGGSGAGMAPLMSALLARPQNLELDATGMSPAEKAQYGIPADMTGKVTVQQDRFGNLGRVFQGWAGVQTVTGPTGARQTVPTNQQLGPNALQNVAPQEIQQKTITLPNGTQALITPAEMAAEQTPRPTGGINPSLVPRVSNEIRQIQTVDNQGNPVTQLQPVQVTRGPLLSGSAPGASSSSTSSVTSPSSKGPSSKGPLQFERPLTPLQQLTEEQKLDQYNTALDRANRVIKNIHMLDSLLESGKLQLALNGTTGELSAIASRGMKFTPAEAQMVTDFNSLKESVNLVRGPLGATGFRGPEAFAALQAQRGNLLSHPDITKGALETFVRELHNQADPIARKLRKAPSGGNIPADSGKTATKAHVAGYAAQKGISVDQATKEFQSAGYQITEQ